MKTSKIKLSLLPLVVLAIMLSATVVAAAGDFDWTRDLNVRAEADRDGFRAQLSTRFNIGDAQVKVVLVKRSGSGRELSNALFIKSRIDKFPA